MQASELRIGNWYNEFGLPKKATGGFIQRLSHIQSLNKVAIDVSGIPLTPEILGKAGFDCYGVYPDGFSSYIKKGVEIHLPYFEFCYSDSDYKTEIKYIHQLQNIYFALTGEELQIEL